MHTYKFSNYASYESNKKIDNVKKKLNKRDRRKREWKK